MASRYDSQVRLALSEKGKKPALELSVHRDGHIEVVDAAGKGGKGKDLEGGGDDAEKMNQLMGQRPKAPLLTVDTDGVEFVGVLDKGDEGTGFMLKSHGPHVLEMLELVGKGCTEAEALRREQVV
jgi:hypothetical protein